jgi:hypothetical protein
MSGVLAAMERHEFTAPGSMVLLGRTLLTLEGTLRVIDPAFDLAGTAGTLLKRQPRRARRSAGAHQREIVHALPALRALPDPAETIAEQLRAGRLTVRTERYAGSDRGWSTGGSTGRWWRPSARPARWPRRAAGGRIAHRRGRRARHPVDPRLHRADLHLVLVMRSAAQSLRRLCRCAATGRANPEAPPRPSHGAPVPKG